MAQQPSTLDKILIKFSRLPVKGLLSIGVFLSIMLLIFSLINIFFLDGRATLIM